MKKYYQFKLMLEEILLENKRSFLLGQTPKFDTSHDQYATHTDAEDIIDHLGDNADPTKNGAYTPWLVKQYKAKNIRQEDAPGLKSDLAAFDKHKSKFTNPRDKDIGSHPNIQSVRAATKPHMPSEEGLSANYALMDKKLPLVHSDGANKTFHVNSKEVSQEMFNNDPGGKRAKVCKTDWCTAHLGDHNMFDRYAPDGPIHVLRLDNGPGQEPDLAQLHDDSGQLMDKENRSITRDHPLYQKHHEYINKVLDHTGSHYAKISLGLGHPTDDAKNSEEIGKTIEKVAKDHYGY